MTTTLTRRTIFSRDGAAALATLASVAKAAPDELLNSPEAETVLTLTARSEAANAALMRGDVATYRRVGGPCGSRAIRAGRGSQDSMDVVAPRDADSCGKNR